MQFLTTLMDVLLRKKQQTQSNHTQCCRASTETNNQRLHFPRYFVTSLSRSLATHSAYVILARFTCRVYLYHERNATLSDKDRQWIIVSATRSSRSRTTPSLVVWYEYKDSVTWIDARSSWQQRQNGVDI